MYLNGSVYRDETLGRSICDDCAPGIVPFEGLDGQQSRPWTWHPGNAGFNCDVCRRWPKNETAGERRTNR
jgi:hypothetical protein